MFFFFNLRFSRLTVVLYYPYGSRLLISCKEVKYEGLGRPQRWLWSPGGVHMLPEMIFLLPCKLFSKFRWPFFCLWYSRLSLNGIFYKKGISVKGHLQLVLSFLWSLYLTVYKTDISLRQTLSARPNGVVDWCLMLLLGFIVVVVFVLVKPFWTLLEEASIREW